MGQTFDQINTDIANNIQDAIDIIQSHNAYLEAILDKEDYAKYVKIFISMEDLKSIVELR